MMSSKDLICPSNNAIIDCSALGGGGRGGGGGCPLVVPGSGSGRTLPPRQPAHGPRLQGTGQCWLMLLHEARKLGRDRVGLVHCSVHAPRSADGV